MSTEQKNLGELELEILKEMWERHPCTVREMAGVFKERRGSAPTTILTVMHRLHIKGFLKRRKESGVYHYTPVKSRDSVISRLIDGFVTRVLDGSVEPFVSYLAESSSLTPEQLETLRKLAKELESQSANNKS